MFVGFNPFINNNPLVFATTVVGAGMWLVRKFGNC